jgi:CubicO group peptidase (beta-lactamase class C family)
MKNIFVLIVVSFLLSAFQFSFGQNDSLDRKLLNIKTKYSLMGLSVTVIKNNEVAFTKSYGLRCLGRNLPVTDSTVYRIASISKTICTIALLQLYEKNKFKLDEDISRYIGFTLRNPNFPNDSITFRKLMSHTASLRDGTGYDDFLSASYNDNPPPSLQSLMVPGGTYYSSDMFSSSYSPSASYFTYANIDFGIAGTLVEKISGERFDVYCKNHILQPLNMSASFNIQDLPNINNVAVLYRKSGSTWTPQVDNYNGVKPTPRNLSGYVIGSNGLLFAPQGGLRVSSYDLSKIMSLLMHNGIWNNVRILNDTTVNKMLASSWVYNGSNGDNYAGIFNAYGLGCHRTINLLPGQVLFGHPGEAYGLISDMYFSKDSLYGIVFITNGGVWGNGNYSGWYNIEEDVYKAALSELTELTTTSVGQNTVTAPDNFIVEQNYPNPFNPSTVISYQLPSKSDTKVIVYDMLGREVAALVNKVQDAGQYQVKFNASKLSSGIYICRVKAGEFNKSIKMILVK